MFASSLAQMLEFGSQIGKQLRPGDLLILTGPLGAGKTALTQGIGSALGITGITSPTFVIAKEYSGKIPLTHIDAYRLMTSEKSQIEFDDLDLSVAREDSIMIIEWGREIGMRPDEDYLEIEIEFGKGEDERLLTFHPHGPRWNGFQI